MGRGDWTRHRSPGNPRVGWRRRADFAQSRLVKRGRRALVGRTRNGRVPFGDWPRARRRAGGRDGDVGGEGVSLEVRRRALDHDAADGGARQHGGRLRAGHHQGRVLRVVRRRRGTRQGERGVVPLGSRPGDGRGRGRVPRRGVPRDRAAGSRGHRRGRGDRRVRNVRARVGGRKGSHREGYPEARGVSDGCGCRGRARVCRRRVGPAFDGGGGGIKSRRRRLVHRVRRRQSSCRVQRSNTCESQQGQVHGADTDARRGEG